MRSLYSGAAAIALALALSACGSDSDTDTTTTTGTDTTTTTDTTSGGDSSDATLSAGKDMVTVAGNSIQLAGTAATGTTVSWEQTSGPAVDLSDVSSTTPTFTAPTVSENTTLTFDVTDGSTTDSVSVEVWVPLDQSDLTSVGDFSANEGWQCDVDIEAELGVENSYAEDIQGLDIAISSNVIPTHTVGTFPNNGNPNTISEQSTSMTITSEPVLTDRASSPRLFGIGLSGVTFDRQTGECYNNEQSCDWRYEAITVGVATNAGDTDWVASDGWIGSDCNNAHVQPSGNYHYHGLPEAFVNQLGEDGTGMVMVGYAADGFPVYARWGYADPSDATSDIVRVEASWEVISGTRPSGPGGPYSGIFVQDWEYVEGSGDLDECSGRFGVTPEYPDGIYHYYLTDDYPFIPRCVWGEVDDAGPPQ